MHFFGLSYYFEFLYYQGPRFRDKQRKIPFVENKKKSRCIYKRMKPFSKVENNTYD
jgi:hypothetical protein